LTTTFATHRSYLRVETVNASTVPNQLDGTPDRGSITQNVYENQFFGFSYRLPDRWVYDKEAALEYNSIEQRRGKEPDPKLEELHELWQSKSYVLLVTSEMSQTRLPLHGPRMFVRATPRLSWDKDKTNIDMLTVIAQSYKNASPKVMSLVRGPAEATYGGAKFACMVTKSSTNRETPFSAVAAISRKGYWLSFEFSAKNLEELDGLLNTLDDMKFVN
jgi:hypothetical protein